ncbi:ATP-binding cassette domain-containing protein [Pedobacter gandavensis]|uniref:ABC transporter ATP-binding protein n=1 Tax=Pedobacter gandavensis TaxID=2679963 RepID=UPI0024794105|nr:ATP-binding cassette domain-containing protein [Pedobacter gandavensis]WGQ08867.1 ATP-binding cassette domain-containing protein [Pedobacter gandavensis]
MISLNSVAHQYTPQQDIRFEDWEIDAGSQWLLLGASGSGKSTLLHILTGILKPAQGKVTIKETSIYDLSAKELDQFRGRNIGIIFQRPHLIKSLSISENLIIAQSFANLPTDLKRVNEVLEALGIADKKNSYPDQLSQGQLQRVSIARAVINKPALLIADEPTSSLDDNNAQIVLELLMQQSGANQATLVVATHDKRVKDAFKNTYELS